MESVNQWRKQNPELEPDLTKGEPGWGLPHQREPQACLAEPVCSHFKTMSLGAGAVKTYFINLCCLANSSAFWISASASFT